MSKFSRYVHFNFYYRLRFSDIESIRNNKNKINRDSDILHVIIEDDYYLLALSEKPSGYEISQTYCGVNMSYKNKGYISSLNLFKKDEGNLQELCSCSPNVYNGISAFQLCLTPKHAKSFKILSNYGMLLELTI